jgi:hypothetical protein
VLYGPSWNPEMNFSLDTLCVTFGWSWMMWQRGMGTTLATCSSRGPRDSQTCDILKS